MVSLDITFSVIDTPQAQGSKRHVGNGVMIEQNHDRLETWREAIKAAVRIVLPDDHEPVDLPMVVYATFFVKRPIAHYFAGDMNRGLRKTAPTFVTRSPDLDKLLRAILDALTGAGVWCDDSRVVRLVASKRYCHPDNFAAPGARIRITEAKE
jgi:Holliday junction resolvase RusA-like endonuclease